MLIAVAIGVVLILLGILVLNKNEKQDKPEIIEDDSVPEYDDEDLAYFKVFYKHNEISQQQEITTYDAFSCFTVEGYNLKNYRKVLYPQKVKWSSPCGVVKFDDETGLENCISCKTKGDYKRNISIKYQNGVTFNFKLIFK